ncbi:Shedu anti-phage system protein SduA domain-containing protein [Burkholderia ubonensis]|uniref:Shedu anti-phage system protein SduA domain-containing protein n=1 Tax=Burkholderia ubonensis TaxID=101571 RepID=UPI0009B3327B|nr:Shedu anti-phage system protein SduA domain-containing protein [Burkholderia ubonensis]
MRIKTAAEIFDEFRARDPLREFYSWWDTISDIDVSKLQNVLDVAEREEDVQHFLQENPKYLIQHLGGGHGRWIIPKQRFGSEHVTDFMIGDRDSMGFHWQAVELESPLAKMFTRAGDPSARLTHAIRQIQDWRLWLSTNQNYAARARDEDGLGLTDIDPNVQGLILMGRRVTESDATRRRRRQMSRDLDIEIHTFDFLVESLSGRIESLGVYRGS